MTGNFLSKAAMGQMDLSTRTAVGYVRVSTEEQNRDDDALRSQAERLRMGARERGLELRYIFGDDVVSGRVGLGSPRRGDMRKAIEEASSTGKIILVTSISRIGRTRAIIEAVFKAAEAVGVSIISLTPGEVVDGRPVPTAMAKIEGDVERIRRATRRSSERRSAAGSDLGHAKSLTEDRRRKSLQTRRKNKNDMTHRLADFLAANRDLLASERSVVAKALNAEGILSVRGRAWNKDSLRAPLARALKEVRERDAIEAFLDGSPDALLQPGAMHQ